MSVIPATNFSLEPTAAGLSVCDVAGRFAVLRFRRCSVSGGCTLRSAEEEATVR